MLQVLSTIARVLAGEEFEDICYFLVNVIFIAQKLLRLQEFLVESAPSGWKHFWGGQITAQI